MIVLPRFELIGPLSAPLVVVLGGISASCHVAVTPDDSSPGWWDDIVGPGRAIDTTRLRVLSVDYRDGGSNGRGRPARIVTTHDQADAIAAVLDAIGVARVRAIVGASYGGMVALAFAERRPERVERLVVISAAHESRPMSTALRAVQRQIVELGVDAGEPARALSLARGLAITTYRSAREFAERFETQPVRKGASSARFPVEDYLASHGERFAATWTTERYLALSLSTDLHRVTPSAISVPTLLVAAEGDAIVPGEQMRELAANLGAQVRLAELPTTRGHDAFLTEPTALTRILCDPPFLYENCMALSNSNPAVSAQTLAVRAAIATDPQHGAVVPPIHLSSTFAFEGFARPRTFDYTRSGNPTRSQLADALADLEGGECAIVTSTGMSAVAVVLHLLEPGDLLLAAHDCYGGTQRLLRALAKKAHFELVFTDLTNPAALETIGLRPPRLLWIETPSNPLLRITDIRRVAAVARAAGSLVVVDNTFLSPALQQPISLGADLVVHSTTKYLNGHSDVVGGAVVAAESGLGDELAWWANCLGVTGSPFDSYLTLRGVRTLHARTTQHLANTNHVVEALCTHAAVVRVNYPGLVSHPGHAIAAAQQSGFGAMVSFEIAGGRDGVECLVSSLEHFTLAESLGGVESLIAHPSTMTHASMDADARAGAGITDSLLRLSVGIESARDLVRDLERGLDRVAAEFGTDGRPGECAEAVA